MIHLNNRRFIGFFSVSLLVLLSLLSYNITTSFLNEEAKDTNQAQVAGESDAAVEYISTSDFTISLEGSVPSGYNLASNTVQLDLYKDNYFREYKYLYNDEDNNASGVVVMVSESDGLSSYNFGKFIENSLGQEYDITSDQIPVPNDYKLIKINNADSSSVYYTLATAYNYYIIQIVDDVDVESYSNFSRSLFKNIYLN